MPIQPEILWFVAGLILVMLEFVLPGVIIVFFGIGAWIAAAATWLDLTVSLESQLVVFSTASLVSLFSLRRYIRSRFTGVVSDEQNPLANYDDFTGRTVTALEDLKPGRPGTVEFRGTHWRALSDCPIKAGDLATIRKLDGITLVVTQSGGEAPWT